MLTKKSKMQLIVELKMRRGIVNKPSISVKFQNKKRIFASLNSIWHQMHLNHILNHILDHL